LKINIFGEKKKKRKDKLRGWVSTTQKKGKKNTGYRVAQKKKHRWCREGGEEEGVRDGKKARLASGSQAVLKNGEKAQLLSLLWGGGKKGREKKKKTPIKKKEWKKSTFLLGGGGGSRGRGKKKKKKGREIPILNQGEKGGGARCLFRPRGEKSQSVWGGGEGEVFVPA